MKRKKKKPDCCWGKKTEKREESRKEKEGFCSFATGRKGGEMGKKEK